jgi:hypothetical protein
MHFDSTPDLIPQPKFSSKPYARSEKIILDPQHKRASNAQEEWDKPAYMVKMAHLSAGVSAQVSQQH